MNLRKRIRLVTPALVSLVWVMALGSGCAQKNQNSGSSDTGVSTDSVLDTDTDTVSETGSETESESESESESETESETETERDTTVSTDLDAMIIPETCSEAAEFLSSVGCTFLAVDRHAAKEEMAVAVVNVQTDTPANVVVARKITGSWVEVLEPETINPRDVSYIPLPRIKFGYGNGVYDEKSFRVTSDVPVAAYIFNPLDEESRTNCDAALLYPLTSLDSEYINVGSGSLFIAALVDDTYVDAVLTGEIVESRGLEATKAGETCTMDMDEGVVAVLRQNLEGTTALAHNGHPIAVFTGMTGEYTEIQDIGLGQWGKHFVAARMPVRELPPFDPEGTQFVIFASEDDTEVTIAAPPGVSDVPASPFTLQKGEKKEFLASGTPEIPGDFRVMASKPISLLGLMTVADYLISNWMGDKYLVQYPSTRQFLTHYVVLVPEEEGNYWPENYVIITRRTGAEVRIDDVAVAEDIFNDVGGGWEAGRTMIEHGVFDMQSDEPFGVIIMGMGERTAFGYVGGTRTQRLNP